MRAKEFILEEKSFTINIPINITIPSGGGDPQISMKEENATDLPDVPVNVFPLQQELELLKRGHGKQSRVINQILKDDGADSKVADEINYKDLSEHFEDLDQQFNEIMNELEIKSSPKK
jgi:hypothetical protein